MLARDCHQATSLPDESGFNHSMRALDVLEIQKNVSPILYRYHLKEPVGCREQLQEEHSRCPIKPTTFALKHELRTSRSTKVYLLAKRSASLA